MLLTQFLNLIVPSEGYKCWVEITADKKVTQGLVPTTEELAAKLQSISARRHDAYFACAAYATPQNRRAGNVLCAQAFWVDIDVGEGKPYATQDEAADACDEFCRRQALPFPGMVSSGSGLHGYWPLDGRLDSATWHTVAQRLKLLMAVQGFHADPSRTADIASILRPVGCKNYKLSNREAAAGRPAPAPGSVEIYSEDYWQPNNALSFIESVLSANTTPSSVQLNGNEINAPYVTAPGNVNAALTGGLAKGFDASKGVVEGGRNSACASYAGALLRKGCTADQALAECLRWNQLNQPPLPDQEVRTTVQSIARRETSTHPPVLPPQEADKLPPLPNGYSWGTQQQMLVKVKEMQRDGTEKECVKVVSQYPVYLKAIANNEHGARDNSYLFCQYSALDGWNEFGVSAEGMNNTNWYAAWYKNGGSLHAGMDKYFRTYVREAENMLRGQPEVIRYNQFGWKDDDTAFLVGDALLKNGQATRAYGTDKLSPLMRTMALPKQGSLEEWTTAANKFFAPGMEAHGFALLCSFAAPLMKFCAGMGDGGSILSLVSEDSGKGKTPISEAIASVWGDLDSTVVTGNFTENRRIESIVRHCNLPQVQEEMTLADPVLAAESVKKFTTGCDRGRLNQRGEGKEIPERYQTILISIANTSLYEMVAQADIAASRRIFEIDVQRPENGAFANLGGITREMLRNRGFAGRRYIQLLTAPGMKQYLAEHLTGSGDSPGSVIRHYREAMGTDAEHRFIVWLVACVHVAAMLVNHYGLIRFDVNRILRWALEAGQEKVSEKPLDDAPEKLNRFLSDYITTCLVVPRAHDTKQGPLVPVVRPQHHMYMRWEQKEQRLFISNAVMKSWCFRQRISFRMLGNKLYALGIIIERAKSVTLGVGTDIPSARCYCWVIDTAHPALGGPLRAVMDVTGATPDKSASQSL